jgi:hypothetical protein
MTAKSLISLREARSGLKIGAGCPLTSLLLGR